MDPPAIGFLEIGPDHIGSPATAFGASGIDVAMIQTLVRSVEVLAAQVAIVRA